MAGCLAADEGRKRKRKGRTVEDGDGDVGPCRPAAGVRKSCVEDSAVGTGGREDLIVPPWGVLPSAKECEAAGTAVVSPPLHVGGAMKATIACQSGDAGVGGGGEEAWDTRGCKRSRVERESVKAEEGAGPAVWWSAATAAAHLLLDYRNTIEACVPGGATVERRESGGSVEVAVVVTGSVLTAHGFAWACRCAGLCGCLRLHVEEEELPGEERGKLMTLRPSKAHSSTPPSGFFVVITTERAYQCAESRSGFSSCLPDGCLPLGEGVGDRSGRSLLHCFLSAASPQDGVSVGGGATGFLLVVLPDVVATDALERMAHPWCFFTAEPPGDASEGAVEENGGRDAVCGSGGSVPSEPVSAHRLRCFPAMQYKWMKSSFRIGVGLMQLEASAAARCRAVAPFALRRDTESTGSGGERDGRSVDKEKREGEHEDRGVCWEVDDRVCSCLANGDVEGAIDGLMARYARYCASPCEGVERQEEAPPSRDVHCGDARERERLRRRQRVGGHQERFYRLLLHTWRCDWGALDLAHAHHRLMDFCRGILHRDDGFAQQVLAPRVVGLGVCGSSSAGGLSVPVHSRGGGGAGGRWRCVGDVALKALHATVYTLPRLSDSPSVTFEATSCSYATDGSVAFPSREEGGMKVGTWGTALGCGGFAAWRSLASALLPVTLGARDGKSALGAPPPSEAVGRIVARNRLTIPRNYLCDGPPSLQLQAFVSHIYPFVVGNSSSGSGAVAGAGGEGREGMPPVASGRRLLDALGERWGVREVLPGCKGVLEVLKERRRTEKSGGPPGRSGKTGRTPSSTCNRLHALKSAALQRAADRLERRIGMRHSAAEAGYVTLVVLLLYEMLSGELTPEWETDRELVLRGRERAEGPLPLCLSVAEVTRRLKWKTSAIGADLGELGPFLQSVELYHPVDWNPLQRSESGALSPLDRGSFCRSSRRGDEEGCDGGYQSEENEVREGKFISKNGSEKVVGPSLEVEHYLRQPVRLPLEAAGAVAGGKEGMESSGSVLSLFARRRGPELQTPFPMPWVRLPIAGEASLHRQRLIGLAAEEILSGMPKESFVPMYIGDVGKLIGKWNHFNAKYEGMLGVGLREFLESQPQLWTVVGNVVTRRKTGSVEPVKLWYDENASHTVDSESDEEGQGGLRKGSGVGDIVRGGAGPGKKKRWLSEKEKRMRIEARDAEKSSKARKKKQLKAFNQSRTNKNYKRMDPAARVPGYVKRVKGKIKGRGKKANIRNFKRGS